MMVCVIVASTLMHPQIARCAPPHSAHPVLSSACCCVPVASGHATCKMLCRESVPLQLLSTSMLSGAVSVDHGILPLFFGSVARYPHHSSSILASAPSISHTPPKRYLLACVFRL